MNSRTSILLALSTGMMMGIVALPFVPKASARKPLPAQPMGATMLASSALLATPIVATVAAPSASAALSPAALMLAKSACFDSVDGFLQALSSGAREEYQRYLTSEALAGLGEGKGLSFDGTGIEIYQVGEAEVAIREASVPVAMTIRGEVQYMDLLLREEAELWSIYGTNIKMGDQSILIDFEHGPQLYGALPGELANESGDPSSTGMQGGPESMDEEPSAGSELLPLEFGALGPVQVEFIQFADRSDPQFTRVDVRIQNHSNKAINNVEVNFHYLGAGGEELDLFPHSLSGSIGFSGQAALVRVDDQKVNNVTAFFMPEGTAALRIEVLEVTFEDQSTWSPN